MYQEIRLTEIRPNPVNPRKNFDGKRFDEMVDSVRQVGVIEPILVRPVKEDLTSCSQCQFKKALASKTKGKKIPGQHGKCTRPEGLCELASAAVGFEIIAGERRWRASKIVANENGGPENKTIPAMVRDVDDDTAFDLMTIENLQRENLTELEEARAFKAWVDKRGPDHIQDLSERCGVSSRYIRRRLAVLELPDTALKEWDEGNIRYGHLEQLLRIKDDQKLFNMFLEEAGSYGMDVKTLRDEIDSKFRPLSEAIFNIEEAGCCGCTHNSQTQMDLFGLGQKDANCNDEGCYKRHVNNHLLSNWKTIGKKYGTSGFRFFDGVPHSDRNVINYGIASECSGCESLVSLVDNSGSVFSETVCIGPQACFKKTYSSKKKKKGADTADSGDEQEARVQWHGTFFRERFYQKRLPDVLEQYDPTTEVIERAILFTMIWRLDELEVWFIERNKDRIRRLIETDEVIASWAESYGIAKKQEDDDEDRAMYYCISGEALYIVIMNLAAGEVGDEIKAATIQAIMHPAFGNISRHLMAVLAGIDLSREWIMTEEYLQKKTKAEILQLGNTNLGEIQPVFLTDEADKFLTDTLGEKSGRFDKLKKRDLIRVFMESGVDLSGRVPSEILRADEFNPGGYC